MSNIIPPMLAFLAFVCALIAGYLLSRIIFEKMHRFTHASSALADSSGSGLVLQLQKGFPVFDRLSQRLIAGIPLFDEPSDRISSLLYENDLRFKQETLISLLLGGVVALGMLGWIVTQSIWFGIAIAIAVMLSVLLSVKNWGDRQDVLMREQIPDAIRSIEMSFRSGHSLPQTLENSSKECTGYLSSLFAASADRLEMGSSTTEALDVMCNNPRVPELSFIAVALDIQHQSGGSIGPVLDSAMDTVEGELKLMRNLRIQTAQAKLSATIVTVMPFVLIALFSIMSPDFLTPFFSSALGIALLLSALGMQFLGVMMVRRMLRVEVV